VCLASIARPAAQKRSGCCWTGDFTGRGDVEDRLGYHVGQLGEPGVMTTVAQARDCRAVEASV
jgi:hypothetical protein